MKQILVMLLVILGGCLAGQRMYCQQYSLIGSDICSDGSKSTNISLSDSDPAKMYAMYRDGRFIEVRSHNSGKSPNVLDFGSYSETGKYTVVEFPRTNPDFEKPNKGREISGSITIHSLPVLTLPKKLEVRSGSPLIYQPQASINGCTFKWTTRLAADSAIGFRKSGEGMITDTITLEGTKPACVIYSITPCSPEYSGSCVGNIQELVVWIKP